MPFKILQISKKSKARRGVLETPHGTVQTPCFMPIATRAAVKHLAADEVAGIGYEMLLSNTYHALLQPGLQIIRKFGGLHEFMQSKLPILTDSGGFQIYSLAKLRRVDDNGVTFQSHLDGGREHRITPEEAVKIQTMLGSDVMMVFDFFPGYPAKREDAERAVRLTTVWARRCAEEKYARGKKSAQGKKQMLFGIVQGSTYRDLRTQSARELVELGFDGYAVGGLAVGEPAQTMYRVLDWTVPLLPDNKPRYLMGVGYPEQIVQAVTRGIDMFDCVIPTREGRHGRLFVWSFKDRRVMKKNFYSTITITNAKFKADKKPIDRFCDCVACTQYSRAYIHHLFRTQEPLGQRLATMHNLRFYLVLMESVREIVS